VAELCQQRGGKAIAVTTDVIDPSECKVLIERSLNEYGRIDTLINNAGIAMRAWFHKLPDFTVLDTVMQINFWGSVYCTYYALPHLKNTKGRIVAVISGYGLFPAPTACGYSASKHAQAGFFDSLRIELAQSGVTVTNIYPEWVATGISARALGKDGKPIGKVVAQEQGGMAPEAYTRMVLKAIAQRQHQLIPGKLKLELVLSLIFPGIADRIAL
jgi:short-subunit dehydrogenase